MSIFGSVPIINLQGGLLTMIRQAYTFVFITLLAGHATAQNPPPAGPFEALFSVDYHGPLVGSPDSLGRPVTEGDLLGGGIPQLGGVDLSIRHSGGDLGLSQYSACAGLPGGSACGVDVDAISLGRDVKLRGSTQEYIVYFTVDEYARGADWLNFSSNVRTESPAGESSANIYSTFILPDLPVFPQGGGLFPRQHGLAFDGNGRSSATLATGLAPGIGLTEPNLPGTGLPMNSQDLGSNMDALSIGPVSNLQVDTVYFSLDGGMIDPTHGYANSNSASFEQTRPGTVLQSTGSVVTTYASAIQLGLGPLDDLDALILWENGIPGFQPNDAAYSWLDAANPTDMLLFSLRRGSPLLGQPDSLMGLPIEEGDLLGPPGPNGGTPMILISGEAMGLKTKRSSNGADGDDLSGATVREKGEKIIDCNNNGIADHIDIFLDPMADSNPEDGTLDECQQPDGPTCFCSQGSPCSNNYSTGGCENSTGVGGRLRGRGSSSIYMDDLEFVVGQLPSQTFGVLFYGLAKRTVPVVMGAGLRCTGSIQFRFGPPIFLNSNGIGVIGPGLGAYTSTNMPAVGQFTLGSTMHFQFYYRDLQATCGGPGNVTNMVSVRFTQ